MTEPTSPGKRSWYSPHAIAGSVRLRPRFSWGVTVGLVALLVLPWNWAGAVRGAVAWDLAGLTYLGLAFRLMSRSRADTIKRHAAQQDDSGFVILVILLAAAASSFAAILDLVGVAKSAQGNAKLGFVLLAGLTIVISWLVTQVCFTLHYAHEHYRPTQVEKLASTSPDVPSPGLIFPDDEHPD